MRKRAFFLLKIGLLFIFSYTCVHAENINTALWEKIRNSPEGDLNKRINYFSKCFIGVPYGSIDYQKPENVDSYHEIENYLFQPEYRVEFSKYDCVLFVETVLALAISNSKNPLQKFEEDFTQNLKRIRYVAGKDSYIYRNHFQSIDWNINNSWLVKDITEDLGIKSNIAECNIDKPEWLFKNSSFIKFINKEPISGVDIRKENVLSILRQHKIDYAVQQSRVKYLLINDVLTNIVKLYDVLPDISIINIVRPNWKIKKYIGTNLNISHVGFIIKQKNNLYFRHASSKNGVEELLLTDYLDKYKESETIKGINVLKIDVI
ncbi:MAG: DUF1460 domain-containing protein [Legionellales bacterium]|nr:DUF1460 domain-containing protein [Legionellales bacterium]